MVPRARLVLLPAVLVAALAACDDGALKREAGPDAGEATLGLTPEQAGRVVAKVGDKTITLGDFARALERMDQFDRLRYQTKERRRELLSEIVDVELLAMEAKRRGLDKRPDAEDAVRQILRDAMLARTRKDLPAPGEIPNDEVRAYYEANKDKFTEPERRRVAAIVMEEKDKKEAEKVLKAALKIKTPGEWGELWSKHSITANKADKAPPSPVDLAGDLGIVGPPDDSKGANPKVPEPVRASVFGIGNVGAVSDALVTSEGKIFIVRMNGITAAHSRSLAEADRSIRVTLLQEKLQQREKALEAELRKKFPVEIDEHALGNVKVPAALEKIDLASGASPRSFGDADAGAPSAQDGGAEVPPGDADGKR